MDDSEEENETPVTLNQKVSEARGVAKTSKIAPVSPSKPVKMDVIKTSKPSYWSDRLDSGRVNAFF